MCCYYYYMLNGPIIMTIILGGVITFCSTMIIVNVYIYLSMAQIFPIYMWGSK